MPISWKVLKYKHLRQARALQAGVVAGELQDDDVIRYAASLVAEWDFVDAETGAALGVGELDELSIDQMGELLESFGAQFSGAATSVPKASAAA